MIGPAPICFDCRHLKSKLLGEPMKCAAFPEKIPWSILESKVDHRKPVAGDHGIQFSAIDPAHPGSRSGNSLLTEAEEVPV